MTYSSDSRSNSELHAEIGLLDGTTIDFGVVDASYANPIRQAYYRLVQRPRTERRIRKFNKSRGN